VERIRASHRAECEQTEQLMEASKKNVEKEKAIAARYDLSVVGSKDIAFPWIACPENDYCLRAYQVAKTLRQSCCETL